MEVIQKIIDLIGSAIDKEPDILITWGNIIASWYDDTVDNYRKIISSSKEWLASYQSELIDFTSISNLKIKYTGASGYFIEVSKNQISNVTSSFVNKQTLVNAGRFITKELLEFQWKLIEAETSLAEKEYEIFLNIREDILQGFVDIKNMSEKVSLIDFTATNSFNAYKNNYCKPIISHSYKFQVEKWRHAVIENTQKDFISNDLNLSDKKYVHIITGPNMWWKSTFLRQNALIVLLAHIGSFIPAEKASIWLVDKIFSRVWANDNLFLGQSTFMVEMQEVANILNNSTENSFVIIDEVWRWTSTYDGMSLAWAILKENHDRIKAKTLFATHYHELIDESESLSWVDNFSVAVGENDGELVFLRKIVKWGIKKSFWLEVAKIAWLNTSVIDEAKDMLWKLELEHNKVFWAQMSIWGSIDGPTVEYIEKDSLIEKEIETIDINSLTPLAALNLIVELKNKL